MKLKGNYEISDIYDFPEDITTELPEEIPFDPDGFYQNYGILESIH